MACLLLSIYLNYCDCYLRGMRGIHIQTEFNLNDEQSSWQLSIYKDHTNQSLKKLWSFWLSITEFLFKSIVHGLIANLLIQTPKVSHFNVRYLKLIFPLKSITLISLKQLALVKGEINIFIRYLRIIIVIIIIIIRIYKLKEKFL